MDLFGFGGPMPPVCENCGAYVGDRQAHERFHDSFAATFQQAYGLSDEEYDKISPQPAAERDARLKAALEALGVKAQDG